MRLYGIILLTALANLNMGGALKAIPAVLVILIWAGAALRVRKIAYLEALFLLFPAILTIKAYFSGIDFAGGLQFETITPILLFFIPFIKASATDKNIDKFISVQLIIFSLDLMMRLASNGLAPFLDSNLRYFSKMGGLYLNSNIAGQLASLLFAYSTTAPLTNRKRFALLFFSITSMSRTAWIVCGVSIVALGLRRRRGAALRLIMRALLVVTTALIVHSIESYIVNDYSFQTKVDFLRNVASNILTKVNTTRMAFGGPLNYKYAEQIVALDGYSPHNPFLKVVIYYGLVGLFLYGLLYSYMWRNKDFSNTLVLCFLLQSFAGLPIIHPLIVIFIGRSLQHQRTSKTESNECHLKQS